MEGIAGDNDRADAHGSEVTDEKLWDVGQEQGYSVALLDVQAEKRSSKSVAETVKLPVRQFAVRGEEGRVLRVFFGCVSEQLWEGEVGICYGVRNVVWPFPQPCLRQMLTPDKLRN